MLCGISPGFPRLSPTEGQVSHVLLTRSPLYSRSCPRFLVRLACVRHAASVDSEPGSNSRLKPESSPHGLSVTPSSQNRLAGGPNSQGDCHSANKTSENARNSPNSFLPIL